IRGRGNAFATGVGNWLVSTLFSQISPIALGGLSWKYYFVFAAFNVAVTIPTVFFVFKETTQKSLEEIDLLFGERASGMPASGGEEKRLESAAHRETAVAGKQAGVHVQAQTTR
ncbi:hypothetical protein LTR28_006536, partial [Elasticomyces elasticus]